MGAAGRLKHAGGADNHMSVFWERTGSTLDERDLQGSDSPGDATDHGLELPAMRVTDATRLPEDDGRKDPGPQKLPEERGPPLPPPALLHGDLHGGGARDLGAGNSKAWVELARDQEDEDDQEQLGGEMWVNTLGLECWNLCRGSLLSFYLGLTWRAMPMVTKVNILLE